MAIQDLDFVKGFCRMCEDGWRQGWHERDAGGLTYLLDGNEVVAAVAESSFTVPERDWVDMGVADKTLARRFFLSTGLGTYLRNVAKDPVRNIGIVQINGQGDAYRILWGLLDSGLPTSEFPSHYMSHCARVTADSTNRVIYHAHTPGVMGMSLLVPLEDRVFTRILWQTMAGCVVAFPQGVGVVPWMVPGGADVALATGALMRRYPAVVRAHQGLFVSGTDFDAAYGLAHTIEKAAELYLTARAANGGSGEFLNVIPDQGLRNIGRYLGVQINQDFVD